MDEGIYLFTFIVLSLFAFVLCIVIRPWRRYKFQALVAPVAFAICSIAPSNFIVDHFHVLWVFPGSLDILFIKIIPGLLGSWCAVIMVGKFIKWANGGYGSCTRHLPPTESSRETTVGVNRR